MSQTTLVATFSSGTDADAAVRELESAGVPSSSIMRDADAPGYPVHSGGRDHKTVSVTLADEHLAMATEIVGRHDPVGWQAGSGPAADIPAEDEIGWNLGHLGAIAPTGIPEV